MTIIPYEEKYRDDMIFMILEAKDALGRVPHLNDDLLDIRANYLDRGDMFFLALDDRGRVIGSVGFSSVEGKREAVLHRLFVKCGMKRRGIGSALLRAAEDAMRARGKTHALAHLGEPREQWFESYRFYAKHGYEEYAPRWVRKAL